MRKMLISLVAVVSVGPMAANAVPITITGYDVVNADVSGTGNWSHVYTGTITPTSGSLADYSGGTGTMADGVLAGTDANSSQLFLTAASQASITLYFDHSYTIDTIDIYGGDHGATGNSIPGALTGFDLKIGTMIQSLTTTGFGPFSTSANQTQQINDRADLVAAGLSHIAVSSITLFNFTAMESFPSNNRFSVAEFVLDGTATAVPEPETLGLLGAGLIGFLLLGRRRRGVLVSTAE